MITDSEAKELKTWVVKKLEDISDADSDVLADYVLALIRADTPEPELRANAISNLDDFLKDNTAGFVDEIFLAIHTKSYIPGYVPPPVSSLPSPPFVAPLGPSNAYGPPNQRSGGYNGALQQSRKRSYNDGHEGRGGFDTHYGRNDRHMKQMRRGDTGGGRGNSFQARNDFQPPGLLPGLQSPSTPSLPGMLPQLPGMAPIDFSDPIAAMLSMQAMGFPGMPQLPQSPTGLPQALDSNWSRSNSLMKNKIDARCRDYDTKGFCARGNACPFGHGDNHIVVPGQDEYDPKNSGLMDIEKPTNGTNSRTPSISQRGFTNGRGRGQGRGDRGSFVPQRRNRADFSQSGPNHDRSITTVVVEQIPEEHFDEKAVRGFFSDFGTVEEVTMQAYKRLAIVKFTDYVAAKCAYESPRVIFDNRFVKVYWYKPDNLPSPSVNDSAKASSPTVTNKPEETPFDKEKFEQDTIAAQKRLEEKKARLKETEAKRQELEKQKEDLARKQEEEKRKLMEKLKAKESTKRQENGISHAEAKCSPNGAIDKKANAQTEALKATLAALEEEAKSLGIDPTTVGDFQPSRGRGRGRGRGSYRGWEGFAGRGGSFDPSRGGSRGRGAFRGARGGGYNLDNRTKRVKVSGVTFNNEKDEQLRQYLLGLGEFDDIEPSDPNDPHESQVITFKDRFAAEKFMYGPKDIPLVGKLEFSWINNPLAPVSLPLKQEGIDTGDTEMGGSNAEGDSSRDLGGQHGQAEVDYDVAEDDDRWMVQ